MQPGQPSPQECGAARFYQEERRRDHPTFEDPQALSSPMIKLAGVWQFGERDAIRPTSFPLKCER
jgi:hypothetical protein